MNYLFNATLNKNTNNDIYKEIQISELPLSVTSFNQNYITINTLSLLIMYLNFKLISLLINKINNMSIIIALFSFYSSIINISLISCFILV